MQSLLKIWLPVFALATCFAPHANGSYYHANVKEGAEVFLFDVRFPFMPSGTYFSFWNGKFFPVGGAFYGGVFTRGPGKTGGPENQKHGTPWTYWGDDTYNGDRPRPVYTGRYTNAAGAGGEGSAAAVGGEKPFLRRGVWFTMCKRVWKPANNNASHRYEGWWIKDQQTGKWHLSAVMRIPAPVTGYSGWSTFVEELAKGADRAIDIRRFYCRLKQEWHSVDTITMDNKYNARFSVLENDSVFHYEEPVNHKADPAGTTSWTVKQPNQPTLGASAIDNLHAEALGDQIAVRWFVPDTAIPQLGYRIELLNDDSQTISEITEMMPHQHIKIISTAGIKVQRVRLTLIDIFDQETTHEIAVTANKRDTPARVPTQKTDTINSRAGLTYELFKLDDESNLETIPDLDGLKSKDGWNANMKQGFVRSGILPTVVLPPREMWDTKQAQYAVRYTGVLQVPKTGFYVFELTAAGNSQLRIDGELVGDNGFMPNPSMRRYLRALQAGPHDFELIYGKRAWINKHGRCELQWEGPGMPVQPFTQVDFTTAGGAGIPTLKTTCKPSSGQGHTNVVDLSVEVDSNGENISRIDVFCGDLILSQLTQPPYQLKNTVLPDGDFDLCARVVYEQGKRTVDSNWISYKSHGQAALTPWQQTIIGVEGAGLGIVKEQTPDDLKLQITGDSHWFLNQPVEGDFTLSGRLVDFPTRTWRDPAYGHVQSRSWLGLMFTLKPGVEPCFYNSYGFYRLAGEGWRGTPCHGDLAGSRRTDYQYPDETGNWIQLKRQDMLFSTSRSVDGNNWQLVRQCLISPRSRHAWRKGVAGVTFRQQPSDAGGGWAQGSMDHVTLSKEASSPNSQRKSVKSQDAELLNGRVIAVMQAPSNPEVWYARTYGNGILKSTDGGTKWINANGNLRASKGGRLYVRTLAVHPKDENIVVMGLGSNDDNMPQSGLCMTHDGGKTWHLVCNQIDFDGMGPSVFLGEVISFNRFQPEIIAAGGESMGLFQSKDVGRTWQRVAVEAPLKIKTQRISALQYNHLLDGHLTVATFPDTEFAAVGFGAPTRKIADQTVTDQTGGGLYSVGEKTIRWGMEPYPGFGFSNVQVNHARGSNGRGFFVSTRGAFKWHRAGLIHSWPNVPQNTFYSQIASYLDPNTKKEVLVSAPFSSNEQNPISIYSKGKLATTTSSSAPLNEGITGISFDQSSSGQTLFVCNRHGIHRSTDRGNNYVLVHSTPVE
ncbi:MAG: PA14 domain-containing protein [Rubripirellula sp.]